jgi:hypothetical protein
MFYKVSRRELRTPCPVCGNTGPWYHFAVGSIHGPKVLVPVNVFTRAMKHGVGTTIVRPDIHTHDAALMAEIAGVTARPAATVPVAVPTVPATATPATSPSVPAPHVRGAIPRVSERADSWTLLAATAEYLDRVLLYGPPGTGKTQLAMTVGAWPGLHVYRVNMTEDTPAAELRGGYIPRGSEWVWRDGPALLAFRNGGRLVVDEITRASDDALSFLLGVLDGHSITLPNGETVNPHPDLSVWGTTNDDSSALTDALADRFVVRVKCDRVNPAALATLPTNVAATVTAGNTGGGVSMREAGEFTRLAGVGVNAPAWLAARLVWEDRSSDVLTAMAIADKLSSLPM